MTLSFAPQQIAGTAASRRQHDAYTGRNRCGKSQNGGAHMTVAYLLIGADLYLLAVRFILALFEGGQP